MLKNKIQLDGMLMIGSAGSNVGKTELACALIRKFSKDRDIIGIKVTTIKAKDGQCPRGGQGCGVCSSLDGDFCITQETNKAVELTAESAELAEKISRLENSAVSASSAVITSGKDTGKLLAAGARRVFWLRVMKSHLKEGIKALLDVIGPDAVSICESNSLRRAVQPGLFLVIQWHNLSRWKNSARGVKQYADNIVISNGEGFDLDLDRIRLVDGKWVLQEQATAIIMAGGASSRMGVDKSMLLLGGKPMIEKIYQQLRGTFSQIIISANEVDKFKYLGVKVVSDREPGQGPLMGIASVLEVSANELNFVVGCDIPYIDLAFVRRMLSEADGFDVVIPIAGKKKPACRTGRYEPLFAIYRKSALAAINETLSAGRRKISDVFERCRVRYIGLEDASWLVNINTMSDYEEFRTRQGDPASSKASPAARGPAVVPKRQFL